jgi:hypothetical protein
MNWTGLAGRLEKKFGLGDNAFAARKVYGHVERLCHHYGDSVYVIVCDMVGYAERTRKPGNCFRGFVLKRIEEHGFPVAVGGPNQSRGEALAEKRRLVETLAAGTRVADPPGKPSLAAVGDDGVHGDAWEGGAW